MGSYSIFSDSGHIIFSALVCGWNVLCQTLLDVTTPTTFFSLLNFNGSRYVLIFLD